MLAASRKDLLLTRLRADGRIVAKDLAAELGVSEDSIRRDLRELDAAGLAVRVYGGAVPASPAVVDYGARQSVATDSKRRVARFAASLIEPGSTVIIDGGTTALATVQALDRALACTIITHSPTVAAALLEHAADVIIIGGRLFKHSAVASGAAAVEAARGLRADRFLLGVTGIHDEAGLTTGDPDEAAMKRALAAQAAETFVLGSAEKIGAVSRFAVLPLEDVTGVVVDPDATPAGLAALEKRGVPLLRAT
ncbi:DeoR/GlpR family DNA-binding transcription regulator [Microbacterium thalli]|uniref:DeoR/GlpR family DNA-binding transcription regulator n=1 Tax=Microbacterium thalli TaxID=3027921 RepID=UPI0023652CE4|nr:DeoR/GlpR family DNA-binding transcription regulator [Microbacterium thalli]MDD7928103.1 DeoR/GlpR family DNA-binding transcription regulator [Microbacterium thalli]